MDNLAFDNLDTIPAGLDISEVSWENIEIITPDCYEGEYFADFNPEEEELPW